MPRGFNNWNFKQVETVLKNNGFRLHHTNGSHYYYLNLEKRMQLVCVPFHGNEAIKPRTMKSIVTQSGLDKKYWKA